MSDIILETIRAIVIIMIFLYLARSGNRNNLPREDGWFFIQTGFAFLSFGVLIDLTDNFEQLSRFVIIGNTVYQAFLEKVIGNLCGFMLIAYGFWKWIPKISMLRESQEKFKVVFDSAPIPMTISNADTSAFIGVNKAALDFFELKSKEEIIGKTAKELKLYEETDRFQKSYLTPLNENGKVRNVEIEISSVKVNKAAGLLSAEIIHLNNIRLALCSLVDISARRESEEKLQKSERLYQTLFNQIADPIFIFNKKTRYFLDVNQAALDRYGYSLDEMLTMTPHHLHPPDELEKVDQYIDDREIAFHQYTHITKQGERLYVEIHTDEIVYSSQDAWISIVRDITERRQAEMALRESEDKYKSLVVNVSDLIFELDEKGEVTSVNESFFDNYVINISEIKGHPFLNFVHPDDVAQIAQAFVKAIETKVMHESGQEFRLVDKDGTSYWFELNANMKFDDDGNYFKAFGTVRNINSRKLAEEALKESERRYRFLADNITDFMWIADLDLKRLKFLSSSINRMGEGVYDTFMSLDVDKTMIPESYQLASDVLKEEFRLEKELNQKGYQTEEELNRFKVLDLGFHGLDGKPFWTETVTKFQRDENGIPIGVYGVARDINERKQAEDEMRKLISLIEKSQDFICYATIEGEVQFINSAGLQMIGLDHIEVARKTKIFDYVPKSASPDISQDVISAIMANQHWIEQTRFWNFKTGETFPVEVNMFPIARSNSNDPTAIAIVGRDLTERQIIEEQLRQSQKMESLGTLAGGIAHDFNNILGVIVGYSSLVLDNLPKNSAERGYQEEVIKASDRATNLINQIRSFSRTHVTELKPILIAPLIQEALQMMRAIIPTTIEIKQDLALDCGHVMADATQIQQIIVNLSNNAVHSMKNKCGIFKISLSEVNSGDVDISGQDLMEGDYLKLVVKDSGEGMTKTVKDRIFEPFFSTKEVNEGTGLGLSIVHGIVTSHNQ